MKLDRLIGILSILLQREKVTAVELAEQFEVSRRTIQRDVDTLCRAGIPLTTAQIAEFILDPSYSSTKMIAEGKYPRDLWK